MSYAHSALFNKRSSNVGTRNIRAKCLDNFVREVGRFLAWVELGST